MRHPAIGSYILKVNEPIPAMAIIEPASLMGPVDRRIPLGEHHAAGIRPQGMIRPKGKLIARFDAPGRAQNPLNPIATIPFRTLHGNVPMIGSVIDEGTLIQYMEPIG